MDLWLSLGLNIWDNVMTHLKKKQSKVLTCSDILMQNLFILLGYTYGVGTSSIAHVLLFEQHQLNNCLDPNIFEENLFLKVSTLQLSSLFSELKSSAVKAVLSKQ